MRFQRKITVRKGTKKRITIGDKKHKPMGLCFLSFQGKN
jgi:hypothetical protein